MEISDKYIKRALSLVLCLILLVSTVAFAMTVSAEEVDEDLAEVGVDTYYLWGENTNSPNFSGSAPTGTFSYDSSKGYYYYDVAGANGDYCFTISTVSSSANSAVKSPAVQKVAASGSYYLTLGNYHGFNCFHTWNTAGDTIRLYFTTPSAGLYAVNASSESSTTAPTSAPTNAPATQAPTQSSTTGGGTTPTSAPSTQAPTTAPATGKSYVYCENEAGWAGVTVYMWNSSSDENKSWPGVAMTNIGGSTWRYELPKTFKNVIFSNNGASQTSDLTFPGAGYIYNNKTGDWEIYDTSPLQVSSFTTDLESPQYDGTGITLNAAAEGEGTVYYKFSVTSGSNTVVLSDYSTKSSVQWVPQSAGTYTLTYEFRDAKGNTNKRTKDYTIESGLSSVSPYIKTVTPAGGEIQRATSVNLSVAAGGGITGTNLLFYKYTVRNSSGTIVNVPYYTLNGSYRFTAPSIGTYNVTVSVQGSDNKTVERTYIFECVSTLTPTEEPATEAPTQAPTQKPTAAPTQPPTQAPTQAPTQKPTAAPTQPPTQAPTQPDDATLLGDADGDGEVTIADASYIQRYDIGVPMLIEINLKNSDVDFDGEVTIADATLIRRFLLGIITDFKRG